jgi:hypothetical protein
MRISNQQFADQTITVGRLIELLQDCDPNAPVGFAAPYGDHGRTEQAFPISDGGLETRHIMETGYSNSGMGTVSDEEIEVNEDEDGPAAVIIGARGS